MRHATMKEMKTKVEVRHRGIQSIDPDNWYTVEGLAELFEVDTATVDHWHRVLGMPVTSKVGTTLRGIRGDVFIQWASK